MSFRSVITLPVGQCGVQIGKSLWEQLSFEHYISSNGMAPETDDPNEIKALNSFFYETSSGLWIPKTLCIDSEPGVMDALRKSSIGEIFNKDFLINGMQDCRNVMGYAWYETFLTPQFHRRYKFALRRLIECCESISGNMYYLSTCGGTGSGLVCKLLECMQDLAPKSSNIGVEVAPSPSVSNSPLETYNTIGYYGLTRYDNLNMNVHCMLDNEALYRIANIVLNKAPTLQDTNQFIARTMSNITASLRYDGQLNVDLNEFQTNLVPFQSMNNLIISNAPIQSIEEREFVKVKDITLRAFQPQAYMCSVDPFAYALRWADEEDQGIFKEPMWLTEAETKLEEIVEQSSRNPNLIVDNGIHYQKHKFLAASMMYRGDVMPAKANTSIQSLKRQMNPEFVKWVPTGFKVGITNSPVIGSPKGWPYKDMNRALTVISNNTVIAERFKHLIRNYFLFSDIGGYEIWFNGGIETDVLSSACDGLTDLIGQYEISMGNKIEISELKDALTREPPAVKF